MIGSINSLLQDVVSLLNENPFLWAFVFGVSAVIVYFIVRFLAGGGK